MSFSLMTISCHHPLSSNSHGFTSIKEKYLKSSIFRRQQPLGKMSVQVGTSPTVLEDYGTIIARKIATGRIGKIRVI